MTTNDIKVFFILGGPGSGKGTNCANLVEDFGYTHLSAGELLREASREGTTELAKKIASIIAAGNIVPSEITVELLFEAIKTKPNPRGFLIDGFPRKADQAQMFEEGLVKAKAVIYFECDLATMEARIMERGASHPGRTDDNIEALRTRFRVNEEQCLPVVEEYKKLGRCKMIDTRKDRDAVYAEVRRVFIEELGEAPLEK